jgi:hypothetical protein
MVPTAQASALDDWHPADSSRNSLGPPSELPHLTKPDLHIPRLPIAMASMACNVAPNKGDKSPSGPLCPIVRSSHRMLMSTAHSNRVQRVALRRFEPAAIRAVIALGVTEYVLDGLAALEPHMLVLAQ